MTFVLEDAASVVAVLPPFFLAQETPANLGAEAGHVQATVYASSNETCRLFLHLRCGPQAGGAR